MNELVAIIFRLINMAVLIGAVVYLFKRYAIPLITKNMAEKKMALDQLKHQDQLLTLQEKEHRQAIIDNQDLYKTLYKKIEKWNTIFKARIAHRDEEKKQLIDALAKKVAKQQHFIAMQHAQKKALPEAITQSRTILIEQFQHADKTKEYIGSLINHLRNIA